MIEKILAKINHWRFKVAILRFRKNFYALGYDLSTFSDEEILSRAVAISTVVKSFGVSCNEVSDVINALQSATQPLDWMR